MLDKEKVTALVKGIMCYTRHKGDCEIYLGPLNEINTCNCGIEKIEKELCKELNIKRKEP